MAVNDGNGSPPLPPRVLGAASCPLPAAAAMLPADAPSTSAVPTMTPRAGARTPCRHDRRGRSIACDSWAWAVASFDPTDEAYSARPDLVAQLIGRHEASPAQRLPEAFATLLLVFRFLFSLSPVLIRLLTFPLAFSHRLWGFESTSGHPIFRSPWTAPWRDPTHGHLTRATQMSTLSRHSSREYADDLPGRATPPSDTYSCDPRARVRGHSHSCSGHQCKHEVSLTF